MTKKKDVVAVNNLKYIKKRRMQKFQARIVDLHELRLDAQLFADGGGQLGVEAGEAAVGVGVVILKCCLKLRLRSDKLLKPQRPAISVADSCLSFCSSSAAFSSRVRLMYSVGVSPVRNVKTR